MQFLMKYLYDLKDSSLGMKLQSNPLAHKIFDELGRGFLMPLLGVPIDVDVRMALGGAGGARELKTAHPLKEGEFSLLLIQPPLPDNLRQKRLVPIGLASLAAFTRREFEGKPFNVGILDGQAQNLSIADMIPLITSWKWDMIGIGFMTVQRDVACRLARAIRKNLPKTFLVAGGNHPTLVPDDVIEDFDGVLSGEGENSLKELITRRMEGKSVESVQGYSYRDANGNFKKNPERPFEKNLDSFPDISWDLLPVRSYDWPLHVVGGRRLPIMASRGCPYGCSFCASPVHWRRTVRYRSPQRVLDEIIRLQKEYKTDYFHFKDDNFGLNREFLVEFLNGLDAANLGITWICTDRARHMIGYRDLLPLMRKTGCIGIEIGVESADPDAYLAVNKEQEIQEALDAIRLQRENGMVPQYTYMAFAPGESISTYYPLKTLLDSIHEGMPRPRFFQPLQFPIYLGQFATVYPGTGFDREKDKQGIQLLEDHDLGHHFNITFLPFTLLEDIPLWTIDRLRPADLELFAQVIWQAFYAQFPGRLPNRRLVMRMFEPLLGLTSFFRFCDGSRTLKKAAGRVADELNWSINKSLRVCALAVYIFAQQGLVRSAAVKRFEEIPIRRVPIPAFRSRILRFLFWKYAPMSISRLCES